ncbi:MAG TPA: hypothetical protein PK402_01025 [Tepidisphaeraceae bacterium]|nr:hypothetical protein [Tepidisphaeraceae bacterium]
MTRTKFWAAIATTVLISVGVVYALEKAEIKWSDPEPMNEYRINGLVGRPGEYALTDRPIRLDQAMISAGEFKGDGPFTVYLQRPEGGGKCRKLYLEGITSGDDLPKFDLMGGDIINVWKKDAQENAQAAPAREGWPTEAEVKAAIFKVEEPLYGANETWHIKGIRHEVKSVKFAERTTEKQMSYGANAITVYPAKVLYTRITDYTDGREPKREDVGADGVWFFYKDSFGDWTAKYGSE